MEMRSDGDGAAESDQRSWGRVESRESSTEGGGGRLVANGAEDVDAGSRWWIIGLSKEQLKGKVGGIGGRVA